MEESFDEGMKHERLIFHTQQLSEKQAESGDRQNEDTSIVLEDEHLIVGAVFDGASAISTITKIKSKNEKTGRFASENAVKGLEQNYKDSKSIQELMVSTNKAISDTLFTEDVNVETLSAIELSNTQAIIARLDKKREIVEIGLVGDSVCLIKYRGGQVEVAVLPDETPEDKEALKLAQKIARPKEMSLKEALTVKEVADIIIAGRAMANNADGKGVGALDGKKSAEMYFRIKEFSLKKIEKIILLSDGMFLPNEIVDDNPDWQEMVRLIDEGGLKKLYEEVLKLKNSDPIFDKYPRMKKHDDATGIVIEIS